MTKNNRTQTKSQKERKKLFNFDFMSTNNNGMSENSMDIRIRRRITQFFAA